MIEVKLTNFEIFMAGTVGLRRRINSIGSVETNKVKNKDFGWHIDIESSCAELAAAKALDLYWNGSVNTFKLPDLSKLQIRYTNRKNGRLIIREGDKDSEVFLLVTGETPNYTIVGFIKGCDAKKDEWKDDPNNAMEAWFVPQSALKNPLLLKHE